MNPTLWGPVTWHVMLACAWTCCKEDVQALLTLVSLMPRILPCEKCRNNHRAHLPKVLRRAKGEPRTPEQVFRFLWLLKDQVNKSLNQPSTSFEDIMERYAFHGGVVDDVKLGDTLVLFAISCHALDMEDEFLELCRVLSILLPLPHDSELKKALQLLTRRPIVPATVRAARAARVERGLTPLGISHYKTMAD